MVCLLWNCCLLNILNKCIYIPLKYIKMRIITHSLAVYGPVSDTFGTFNLKFYARHLCLYKEQYQKSWMFFAFDFSSLCVSSLMIYVWSQNKTSEVWKRACSGYVGVWISHLCTNLSFGDTCGTCGRVLQELDRNCSSAQHLFNFFNAMIGLY